VKWTTQLHLVPRSKNEWSYSSTPQYAFMAWYSDKAQEQLYLYTKQRIPLNVLHRCFNPNGTGRHKFSDSLKWLMNVWCSLFTINRQKVNLSFLRNISRWKYA